MDARHFDRFTRALTEAGTRRGLLGLLATLPVLGGLFALRAPENLGAKGRRKRRKKRHKHRKGNSQRRKGKNKHKHKNKHKKQKCKAHSQAKTCAGKCGPVKNNCQHTVDCGPCACDPPCGACATCTAALVCEPCEPCCNDGCCTQAQAVCHRDTGACCVPESHAQTCDGQCGEVVNTCGLTVDCGPAPVTAAVRPAGGVTRRRASASPIRMTWANRVGRPPVRTASSPPPPPVTPVAPASPVRPPRVRRTPAGMAMPAPPPAAIPMTAVTAITATPPTTASPRGTRVMHARRPRSAAPAFASMTSAVTPPAMGPAKPATSAALSAPARWRRMARAAAVAIAVARGRARHVATVRTVPATLLSAMRACV